MKRSPFRPRPYLPPVNCPYSMLGSPRCCGGKLIDDPLTKTCCRDRIILKSQVSSCRRMSKCGHVLYNRDTQRCCKDHVIPRHVKCKRLRCNRDRYYPFLQQCCNGKLISKHMPCTPFPSQSHCGGIRFDPRFYKCCFSQLVFIHSSCPASRRLPCGHAFYDPQSQQCCQGQVLVRFAPCIPFECGGLNYNPQTHQCCNGQIVSRFQRCPVPGPSHQFCGGNFIDPSLQRCCHGNVVAPLRSTCQRCGASFFVPSGFQCCHGNQVVPSSVQCIALLHRTNDGQTVPRSWLMVKGILETLISIIQTLSFSGVHFIYFILFYRTKYANT